MSLPWVRIDTNLASHDKILSLLDDSSAPLGIRYRAAFSYVCAIGWSADRGTDGDVPSTALPFIHGTKTTGRLLTDHKLWEQHTSGLWVIHNYAERQITTPVVERKRTEGKRAACIRWHGVDCWTSKGCSRDPERSR